MYVFRAPGGSVKAEGLGDGPTHCETATAKLRLTMPRNMLGDLGFALVIVACLLVTRCKSR
jgi:hypothetical protein